MMVTIIKIDRKTERGEMGCRKMGSGVKREKVGDKEKEAIL